jgi:HlyD family secretion protein
MKKRNRLAAVTAVAITIGVLVWAYHPKPIKVQTGRAERGELRVTVDEEAETRVHDRFEIATPVTGRLRRIELHAADPVEEGQIVARVEPLPLDARERSELLARLEQARANQREADALVERTQVDRDQARRNHERAAKLQASGVV